MAEGTEPIRQDIDEIRDNMTSTMEQIESRVRSTVDDTVGSVRATVDNTVENVRGVFDVRRHTEEKPWLALGVAVALGYALGSMGGDSASSPQYPARRGEALRYYSDQGGGESTRFSYSSREGNQAIDRNREGHAYASGRPEVRNADRGGQVGGFLASLAAPFGSELDTIAQAAVRSVVGMLRDSLSDSIPQFGSEYQRVRSERGDDSSSYDASSNIERAVGSSTPSSYSSTSTSGSMGSTSGSTSGSMGSTSGSAGTSGTTSTGTTSTSGDIFPGSGPRTGL